MQRFTVRYEGRVQGVGFRATVSDLAQEHDVVGYVRNMRDGSVEMVLDGESSELVGLDLAVRARLSRNIVRHHEAWQEIQSSDFESFSIAPSESI